MHQSRTLGKQGRQGKRPFVQSAHRKRPRTYTKSAVPTLPQGRPPALVELAEGITSEKSHKKRPRPSSDPGRALLTELARQQFGAAFGASCSTEGHGDVVGRRDAGYCPPIINIVLQCNLVCENDRKLNLDLISYYIAFARCRPAGFPAVVIKFPHWTGLLFQKGQLTTIATKNEMASRAATGYMLRVISDIITPHPDDLASGLPPETIGSAVKVQNYRTLNIMTTSLMNPNGIDLNRLYSVYPRSRYEPTLFPGLKLTLGMPTDFTNPNPADKAAPYYLRWCRQVGQNSVLLSSLKPEQRKKAKRTRVKLGMRGRGRAGRRGGGGTTITALLDDAGASKDLSNTRDHTFNLFDTGGGIGMGPDSMAFTSYSCRVFEDLVARFPDNDVPMHPSQRADRRRSKFDKDNDGMREDVGGEEEVPTTWDSTHNIMQVEGEEYDAFAGTGAVVVDTTDDMDDGMAQIGMAGRITDDMFFF